MFDFSVAFTLSSKYTEVVSILFGLSLLIILLGNNHNDLSRDSFLFFIIGLTLLWVGKKGYNYLMDSLFFHVVNPWDEVLVVTRQPLEANFTLLPYLAISPSDFFPTLHSDKIPTSIYEDYLRLTQKLERLISSSLRVHSETFLVTPFTQTYFFCEDMSFSQRLREKRVWCFEGLDQRFLVQKNFGLSRTIILPDDHRAIVNLKMFPTRVNSTINEVEVDFSTVSQTVAEKFPHFCIEWKVAIGCLTATSIFDQLIGQGFLLYDVEVKIQKGQYTI